MSARFQHPEYFVENFILRRQQIQHAVAYNHIYGVAVDGHFLYIALPELHI
jgi:hypothetical protein